ncbi:ABC transporter ATP-binding protein [Megamonas funiformis]|uniref:ABC transporter ATP-binding protein n=1 Tax=Megamonas funiformis TaxID=437897 RepID=UPI0014308663|nr:ABC transporter ATP-binding protein [Megamonas funiformis]NJE29249.1 ABC transporter ATP-binding protein [Megamonas funiformis]
MDNNMIIKVENISKIYKIFDKPIDRMKEALNPLKKRYSRDFYALNDVSFTIKKGESVGFIGKNGAGKSTILKILTGVLTPTNGSVTINGKVASLLELGAGFNPEMTGLENIYLNGSLMGYSDIEMDSKVNSIIEFADIGDFINQPVKMYSSGMFARLAFAVNIAVEPDILIVDEALAVGDFMFQHKCIMRMKDLQKKGTTILFVSHSMQQIISTCSRAILLHHGRLIEDSYDVQKICFNYENLIRNTDIKSDINKINEETDDIEELQTSKELNEYRFGTHEAIIKNILLKNQYGRESFKSGDRVKCKIYISSKKEFSSVVIGISFKNINGEVLWGTNNLVFNKVISLKVGINIIEYEFVLNISSGEYLFFIGLADISTSERIELDQRWPIKKINIISDSTNAEGYVYMPVNLNIKE